MTTTFRFYQMDVPSFFVTDLQGRAFWAASQVQGRELQLDGIGKPFMIYFYLRLPQFGPAWVACSGGGAGLLPGGSYDAIVATLQSRLNENRHVGTGSVASSLAEESQARAEEALSALSATSGAEAELIALRALGRAIIAGEEWAFAKQKQGLANSLPRHMQISSPFFGERLGPWSIGIGPDWGVDQEAPDFLLPKEDWVYVRDMCDATVLPSFWRWVEPRKGLLRWEPLDIIVEYAVAHGMKIRSFPLFFPLLGGLPAWWRDLSYCEQLSSLERWVRAIVTRYRGIVSCWGTVNEVHDWANLMGWSHQQILHVTRLLYEWVAELDPASTRLVDMGNPWGSYVQGLNYPQGCGPVVSPQERWTPLSFIDALISEHVPFDAIGLHMYFRGQDLWQCGRLLDHYLAFGKPVWITEMGTPSQSARVRAADEVPFATGWRGAWTPESQADWVERWYTLLLSTPGIENVNYWDVDDRRAYIKHAGLLDVNGNPKPAYKRLLSFCREYGVGQR